MEVGANKQRRKPNNGNYYEDPKNCRASSPSCRLAVRGFFTGAPIHAETSLRDGEHRDCPSLDQTNTIGNARLRTSVSDTPGTSYPTIAEEKPVYADYGLMNARAHKLRSYPKNDDYCKPLKNSRFSSLNCRLALREFSSGAPKYVPKGDDEFERQGSSRSPKPPSMSRNQKCVVAYLRIRRPLNVVDTFPRRDTPLRRLRSDGSGGKETKVVAEQ